MLTLKKRMIAASTIYLILLALLFIFQRNLQYLPSGKISDISNYPLEGFTQKFLITQDSFRILSWYKKPASSDNKIILYFHGNAGNIGDRAHKLATFAKDGFGIMAISYRGYSGSEGSPTQTGLMLDAQASLDFLFKEGYKAEDIILFGESLGSGVAMQLATKYRFAALILESPYSSIVSVAKKSYWFVPVNLLLKDKFESVKAAPKITSPILIIHGTNDQVVSYDEGKKLYRFIQSKKKFTTVDGAGHLDFSEAFLLKEIKEFMKAE